MEKLASFLIRPFRSEYSDDELGPKLFLMNENIYERQDFLVLNKKNQNLSCSMWYPKVKQEENYLAVIFCHGNCGNKLNVFEVLELLLQNNIIVISFDFSGAGNSEGNQVTYGFNEKDDIKSVIEYIYQKFNFIKSVALWGRSMGAASILLFLSSYQQFINQQLNDFIICAICDSPFANLSNVILNVMSNLQIPTSFIRNYLFSKIQTGFENQTNINISSEINPEDKIDMIKNQSIFFIHGDQDTLIPISHSLSLYSKSNKQCRLNIHPGGTHNDRRTDDIYLASLTFIQGQNILKQGKMFTQHKKKKTIKQEFINHFTKFSNKNLNSKKKKQIYNLDKSLNNQNLEESDQELLNLSQNNINSNINQNDQSEILSDNENSNIKIKKLFKQNKVKDLKDSLRKKQQNYFSNTNQKNTIFLEKQNVNDFYNNLDDEYLETLEQCRLEDEKKDQDLKNLITDQQKEQNDEIQELIMQNSQRKKKSKKIRKNRVNDFIL